MPKQISLEHFIYAPFQEHGYRLIKSMHVYDQIDDQELLNLCRQGGGVKEETVFTKAPNVTLAITFLKPVKDEIKRNGLWNHTILIKLSDLLSLVEPTKLFSPFFIKCLSEPLPKTLLPIVIGEQT